MTLRPKHDNKICTECNENLPVEEYSWYTKTHKNGEVVCYPKSKCRKCFAALRRKKYHDDPAYRQRQIDANKAWIKANPKAHKKIRDRMKDRKD